jgi:predicted nucleic acid-binding protein
LHQLGQLDLLRTLYSRLLVPESVVAELQVGRARGHEVPTVADHPWMVVVSSPTLSLLALATDLGQGESEAIAVAHERRGMLILDDALARRHATLLGVPCTGTLGVLLKAKVAGHLKQIAPLVHDLVELGFHLAPSTREAVLRLAGEA